MEPTLYEDWLAMVLEILPDKKGQLLELAGGSGRLAVMLAQNGYQVTDFDLSAEMLSLADMHAQEANVELGLIQGDMTDLSELAVYDNITCFADSFCYLPDETALLATFTEVAQHLAADGKFIFDVITPYQTDEVYPGYMFNYNDEERAFMWQTFIDEQPHSVVHDLTFFIYNEQIDGYERINELHHERTYSLVTYQKLLKEAGFTQVEVTADFGRQKPNETTTRWFFQCQK